MAKFKTFIKYTGSKRTQAPAIISYFPDEFTTYYEPFLGSGSVMFELLRSNKKFTNIIASDLNSDLIGVFDLLKNQPGALYGYYEMYWNKINKLHKEGGQEESGKLYYELRDRYNNLLSGETERAQLLFLLTRHSFNGLIRYNQKTGNFNASYCHKPGPQPEVVADSVEYYYGLIKDRNIDFISSSYDKVLTNATESSVIYMDPPYEVVTGCYLGDFDSKKFFEYITKLPSKMLLSYDGISGEKDNTSKNVPEDFFIRHEYIDSGVSNFRKLKNIAQNDVVKDSLYMNY